MLLLLLQVRLEEFCYLLKEVIACVAAIVDAMVAVGVDCHLELLVRLCQCVCVANHVAQVYVVVGCAVDEQQVTAQLVYISLVCTSRLPLASLGCTRYEMLKQALHFTRLHKPCI